MSWQRCSGTLLAALLLLLLAACDAGDGTGDAGGRAALRDRNLLLVTLDTARRDHFSCYGAPGMEGTTPEVDRLAAQGALFLNAYSETNVTNPSHVTIHTGLRAIDAVVMNNHTKFGRVVEGVDTLASAFRRAGYQTASFPATPHLSSRWLGLPDFEYSTSAAEEPDASQIADRFLAWLDGAERAPFFAWVHVFDPHAPYRAPEPFRSLYYEGDPESGSETPLGEDAAFQSSPQVVRDQFSPVRDRDYPAAMYRAEVRFTDEQIGRMLRGLELRGLWDDTAVVLVADHGESLGEHGVYYDHARLYEPSLRIPLVIRAPGFPAGVRVAAPTGHIDLAPTLRDLFDLDLAGAEALPGVSPVDALAGDPEPEVSRREWMVHESAHNLEVAVRSGEWKAIFGIWGPAPEVQLFHLGDDPNEQRDLSAGEPERVAAMREVARRWIDTGRWIVGTPIEKHLEEGLRKLGYIEEAPDE